MIAETATKLRENIQKVIVGKDDIIDLALIAMLTGGHLLLEDVPGTGKTTLIGTLVNSLWKTRMKSVLMAPTGRAAKVMSNYSNTQAFTIHRKIYFPKKQSGGDR